MKRFLMAASMLAGLSISVCAEDKPDQKLPPPPKHALFDAMKSLAGTWVTVDKDGKPTDQVQSIIKVTAGGSAVEETFFPGKPMEMVSVYTVDGPDLLLTHYCVLGNQPRLKANAKSTAGRLQFEFVAGGNMDVKKDRHMHASTLKIVDANHIEIEGTGWVDGKPESEMCGTMKLARKQ